MLRVLIHLFEVIAGVIQASIESLALHVGLNTVFKQRVFLCWIRVIES